MAEVVVFKELYSWQSDHDQAVFVDGANEVVIYQSVYDKSIRVIDSATENTIFNNARYERGQAVTVTPNQPLCEVIAFSADGRLVLYWHNHPLAIGIVNGFDVDSDDILVDCTPYEETIVLNIFWLEAGTNGTYDFAVVCTTCIDIYSYSSSNQVLRRVCSKRISCTDVWNDVSGTHVIVLKSNQVLQLYRLINKEVRAVTDIELAIKSEHKLHKSSIIVATIYNDTYCIHKDASSGTISLRSLRNSKAVDIVLELSCQGWLEIAILDNVVLALTGGGETYLFDIAMTDKRLLARVPQSKPAVASMSSDVQAFIPNVVVDYYGGFAYNIAIDHNMLMLLLSQKYAEPLVADFYQRRIGSAQRVLDIVNNAIENKSPRMRANKLLVLLSTIVAPYAKVLVDLNKLGTRTEKNVAIPFNLVEEYIGQRSVISEHRFAKTIIYAAVAKEWNLKPGENVFDAAIALLCHHRRFDHSVLVNIRDELEIQPNPVNNFILKSRLISSTKEDISADFRDYVTLHGAAIPNPHDRSLRNRPYIIVVTLSYLRALVAHNLQPTNVLQILLLDMCVLYNNIDLALQLIRSKNIRDSAYVCYRLLYLYVVLRDPALRQICLDMAIRLKLYGICVKIAVIDEDYYSALVVMKAHGVASFPMHRILYCAAKDVEAQERKPHLWPSMLAFIKSWAEESATDGTSCAPPNLRGCEMWLPSL
ncbi:hypothetical protein, conserved [Babesia bigemina]|uniref:Mic1 domain-containing protein n=1 Tax=Babesia bigemina TaxID=5866 RepID=A0A061D4M0_BABBI|nr:hypothetical protein, conserved [Babesia bigemina]CDR93889.1 hypothetical protein, conserved [Babesia bigemina]|eukprot:XP_012766075.1 hypothetical protein, conserved [Babesia bigemina]